jgi:hypothetical protein
MQKAQEDNLNFKCADIDDADWAERIDTRIKEKKCKPSKETRAEIKADKAAKRAARKALKDARAAFKAAKVTLTASMAKGKAECEG